MATRTQNQVFLRNTTEYYLRLVRAIIRYAGPIAALLLLMFVPVDWHLIPSFEDRVRATALRSVTAALVLVFWWLAPRIRSMRVMIASATGVYFIALMTFLGVLLLIPGGLAIAGSGLLLITVCGTVMLLIPPIPATTAGLVGVSVLFSVSLWRGLPTLEMMPQVLNWGAGVLVSGFFLFLLDRELRQKHVLELSLQKEMRQSETLLKEILPRYVIQRIREGADNIAESVAEVNVIFIDIVGFTSLSKRLAPKHLVEVLAGVFQVLDGSCEKRGVTKIKTIGDAYMAATGAPEPADLSAIAAVEFCLEAIDSVAAIAKRMGIPLNVRLGIATGAVISGVLSLKRPAYDLWGDTVNLASRMESTGEPGVIHIAETTYWRVKDKFICEPCGTVEIKGFASIQTYFVRGRVNMAGKL